MNKFKVGNEVKIKIGKILSEEFRDFANKNNGVHTITSIASDGDYRLDNEEFYFFTDKDLEMYKPRQTKFEVGNYVKSSCFEGVRKITRINDNNTINVEGLIGAYLCENCELVCNFTILQKIEVNDNNDFTYNTVVENFITYCPELEKPFITIDNFGDADNWKYARVVPEEEYRAYLVPRVEWLQGIKICKKDINDENDYRITRIFYVDGEYRLGINNFFVRTLQELFENFIFENGEPFGELIK